RHRGGAAERRTRKLLHSVASGGQEPHKLTNAIELAAHNLAERVAELLHGRLHLHDNYLIGQRTEVARHDERVVEGDNAGHRFGYGALDLLVRWQHAIPAIGSDGAGRAATPLDSADYHDTLEPLLRRLVLQTLDDRDRVVAQILNHDVIRPRRCLQAVGHLDPDRVITQVAVSDPGDDDAQS